MKRKLLLGIDIGTQSIRAGLYNEDGKILAINNISQTMETPRNGWAVQNPESWWESTVKNIKKVIANTGIDSDEIVGIGVCAHMHGPVPINGQGKSLTREIQLYCDKRSTEIAEEFNDKTLNDELYDTSSNVAASHWYGFKVKWSKENEPDLYNQAWKFLVPKDYINYRLTAKAVIDPSEASGTFLMDSKQDVWAPELINKMGLDIEKLPSIHGSSSIIGGVTKDATEQTGLAEGTPVVCGGGDMLASLLTSGMTKPGRIVDVTGTGSIICAYTEKPIYDRRLMNLRHVIDGWIPFGCVDSSGGTLRWFRDEFCQVELEEAERTGSDAYDIITRKASHVDPGADKLLFFPYLMGQRTLGTPYARGMFVGLTPRHGKAAMARAIMEGITFEHLRTLRVMESAGYRVTSVYHSGGAGRSSIWSQIKADIYQKPVYTLKAAEGGLLGAAILAGTGAGIYPDAGTGAEKCTAIEYEYFPKQELADRYAKLFEIYQQVHDCMQDPFINLAEI